MIELKLLTDVSIRNAQIFICESSETISIISIISKMMLLGCGLLWMLSIAAIQIQKAFGRRTKPKIKRQTAKGKRQSEDIRNGTVQAWKSKTERKMWRTIKVRSESDKKTEIFAKSGKSLAKSAKDNTHTTRKMAIIKSKIK